MVGDVPATDWLEMDWVLNHFGRSRQSAVVNYPDFAFSPVHD
jgi:putative transposase